MKSIIIIFICVIFFASNFFIANGSFLSGLGQGKAKISLNDKLVESFPDYSDLSYEEVAFKTDEISLSANEWFTKVKACIQKCMELNPHETIKSNCVAKMCEFY
jgi:hypothetical protein